MNTVDFFYQIIGFLLQVMPPFLLSFVPFKEENMRLKKKNAVTMQVVFCLVGAVFFAVIMHCIYKPTDENNVLVRNVANIYMTLFIVLCAFFLIIVTKVNFSEKLLIMGMIVHVGAIEYSVINVVIVNINPAADGDIYLPYQINSVLIFAAFTVVVMPLIYCFFKRVMKSALPNMDNRIIKRNCGYVFIVLALFCLSDYAFDTLFFAADDFGLWQGVILVSLILTDCIFYFMIFSEVRLAAESLRYQNQLRHFESQYEQISANTNLIKRMRHDMRHHLNVISTMAKREAYSELEEYLKHYQSEYAEIEDIKLSNYPALDNILSYYTAVAKSKEITVKSEFISIDGKLRFDAVDLTVLLGNIMENAIENCSGKKILSIWIKQRERSLLISVENTCEQETENDTDFHDGSDFVSKKHLGKNGQGIASIHYIADKYSGTAEFKKADNIFAVRVVLNDID